ncbi:hypothetical protein [Bacillus salipaludis]|uniref:hypothetical protein n=1 Tax=Bacillus salipaludis TaxID=2547811 RepID=UPI002E20F70F|nr:hypothetical protein [Bacillus salipaludis]
MGAPPSFWFFLVNGTAGRLPLLSDWLTLFLALAMAKLDATDEEIMAAAKKAFAHEFISTLPKG